MGRGEINSNGEGQMRQVEGRRLQGRQGILIQQDLHVMTCHAPHQFAARVEDICLPANSKVDTGMTSAHPSYSNPI